MSWERSLDSPAISNQTMNLRREPWTSTGRERTRGAVSIICSRALKK